MPLGIGIGFLGSLAGIGGGLFAVPVLYLIYRASLPSSVATSLIVVAVTTSVSTLTEIALGVKTLHWWMIAAVSTGSLLGAQLGFLISSRLSPRRTRLVFILVLTVAGFRVLHDALGFGGPVIGPAEPVFAAWQYLLGAAVGFAGGVIAPLLGISGGLLVTPGLYMLLPGLGFTGARATSLAAGFVASTRSLWLHSEARRPLWKHGFGLAIGAVLGAILGTTAVHQPHMALLAQAVLCAVLFGTAFRFVRELRTGRAAGVSK